MTSDDAKWLLDHGRAQMDSLGWWIAHEIGGELEWFRVNDEDADVFDAIVGVKKGSA